MRLPVFGILVVATFLLTAHAQRAVEWEFCDSKMRGTPDVRIRNCSALIESSRESPSSRAAAHNNRGEAWRSMGDADRALADYTEAIRLDPKYPAAYSNRESSGTARANSIVLSLTTVKRSGSIRVLPMRTTTVVSRCASKVTLTAQSPTTPRQSGSIRRVHPPTPQSRADLAGEGRQRASKCRF